MALPTMPRLPTPLGLPQGSVRAILALVLCGSLWYQVVRGVPLEPVLLDSALLVVAFYFGVRSTAPPSQPVTPSGGPPGVPSLASVKQPLHLPRGTVRGILLLGFFGVIAYLLFKNRSLNEEFVLILQVLGSYLVGFAVSQIIERRRRAEKAPSLILAIWRNANAVAAIALTVYMCGVLLRGWSQVVPAQYAAYTSNALAWVVAYYFGSRVNP